MDNSEKNLNKISRNGHMEFTIEDGILYGKLIGPDKLVMDLEMAKTIVKERLELSNGKDYPVVLDLDKLSMTDKSVRDFMNKEGTEGIKAGAIVTKKLFVKHIMNFFLKVSKPDVPAKIFSDEKEAVKWLKKYVD